MTEVRDVLGRPHAFARPPQRVVSLVPSLTETLFDIGAGGSLAAATDYCLFPAESLAGVPRIGGTKNPRIDEIRAIAPDLVYVNVEENLPRHADQIEEFAPVFATEPKTVPGVLALLADLGIIHGVEDAAAAWRERIGAEIVQLGQGMEFSFACAIWKDPWMWCGGDTYVSDLVTTAGGRNVFAGLTRYPKEEPLAVLAREPEIVFLPDEPYPFTGIDAMTVRAHFLGRVIGPFPGHLFTWHGTRTAKGLAFLREALNAE